MSESIGRETETAMKSARDLWSRAFAVPPQVMGWSATAPGQQLDQIERALSQFWRVGGGEWGEYAHVLMRTNVEIASLVGRRTRAMFEHPIRLSMCRTPQQLLESQAEFIEGMMRDYRTMSEHLIDYWTGAASRERR